MTTLVALPPHITLFDEVRLIRTPTLDDFGPAGFYRSIFLTEEPTYPAPGAIGMCLIGEYTGILTSTPLKHDTLMIEFDTLDKPLYVPACCLEKTGNYRDTL